MDTGKSKAARAAAKPFPLSRDGGPPQEESKKKSQATTLVELAAGVELFHTPDREAWATTEVNGHREHWPLKSKGFRLWLAHKFYEEEGKTPGTSALQAALSVLEGKALFDGEEHRVYTRVAEHDGVFYLDLANDRWETVEITETSWRVVFDPPVKFCRSRGMLPLPYPTTGGSVEALRCFVNVGKEESWALLLAWLLMSLSPKGPYPILVFHGEQGSAKSTTARVLKALVDPSEAPLKSGPREVRDLMISAGGSWVLCYDNLSYLPGWLSDSLCRLATGGGFSTRELYTDREEVIFSAQRPTILNGIEELVSRGDLLDRAIILYLPTIPEKSRRQESKLWREFEEARPRILGALLSVVAGAKKRVASVRLSRLPRMADFATWVTAAEPSLGWEPATFLGAYTGNREAANELALEASPVAATVRKLVEEVGQWTGTAKELLEKLSASEEEKTTRSRIWPKSPRTLSNTLRRLAPNLRAIGIQVDFSREPGSGRRLIALAWTAENLGISPSPASPDFLSDDGDASNSLYSKDTSEDPEAARVEAEERAGIKGEEGDPSFWEEL